MPERWQPKSVLHPPGGENLKFLAQMRRVEQFRQSLPRWGKLTRFFRHDPLNFLRGVFHKKGFLPVNPYVFKTSLG